MKKDNTAEKTIQDAERLSKALKESTEKSLKDLMNEAISNIIKESDEEDDEPIEDEVPEDNSEEGKEEEDVNSDDVTSDEDKEDTAVEDTEDSTEDTDPLEDGEGDEDEWSDLEQYKVGDNDYDFTGVDGDTVLKVYNKLNDDDKILVKQTEDGNYEIKDDETGAEYVIELNDDADIDDFQGEEDDEPEDDADIELELGGDDSEDDLEPELSDEDGLDGEDLDIEFADDEDSDEDDENKDELDEDTDLMTNEYQKKTAMTLPKDGKSNSPFDAGAPKGGENAARPYGKRGNDNPFDKSVNECGDGACGTNEDVIEEDGSGLNTKHSTKKSTNRINRSAQNQRNSSENGEFQALREGAVKIYNKAKEIQKENKQYKECIAQIKKSLKEAAVLNVNLTQIVKLLSENTTTQKEKKDIVERFNRVTTIKESKTLYDSIKRELNESRRKEVVLEHGTTASPLNTLNETTIYKNSKTSNPALDLMSRMDNLWK
jgi:hypothetical protein